MSTQVVLDWTGVGAVTVEALNGAPFPGGWRLGDPGVLVAAWEFSWPRMESYTGLFKWLKLEHWYTGRTGTPEAHREYVEVWPEHVEVLVPDDVELTDGAADDGAFHEADVPRLRFGFDFSIEHVLWNPLKYGGVLAVVRDPGRDHRRAVYQTIRREDDVQLPDHEKMLASAAGREVGIVWSDENGLDGFAILHPDDPPYWLGQYSVYRDAEAKARELGCIPRPACRISREAAKLEAEP